MSRIEGLSTQKRASVLVYVYVRHYSTCNASNAEFQHVQCFKRTTHPRNPPAVGSFNNENASGDSQLYVLLTRLNAHMTEPTPASTAAKNAGA